jgi:hypothetical protein
MDIRPVARSVFTQHNTWNMGIASTSMPRVELNRLFQFAECLRPCVRLKMITDVIFMKISSTYLYAYIFLFDTSVLPKHFVKHSMCEHVLRKISIMTKVRKNIYLSRDHNIRELVRSEDN